MDENKENTTLKEENLSVSSQMTVYDFNKMMYAQMPAISQDRLDKGIKDINRLYARTSDSYYMLLCKEESYYTLFLEKSAGKLGYIVTEVMKELGEIKSIDPTDNEDAIEIWLTWNKENDDEVSRTSCFYLFPYERGVIVDD